MARLLATMTKKQQPDFERSPAAASALDRQQFRQRADNAIGLNGGFRGQAFAVCIDPDGIDTKALRHFDFPFQIVTDHPGLGCRYAERLHGMLVGALVRFAEAMLALDLDMI